ncbi:MAG: DUF2092 domain-containing protein [Deltaproteobacteria bacterium]|nr:DUF2092 domain-containing protein [Deltaproteobacteria bacterium]MBW2398408.1 DUF2092 domain-containing protein [Deltaproteobacteria bacterium]
MTLSLQIWAATLVTAVLLTAPPGWADAAPGGDESSEKKATTAAIEANTAAAKALLEQSADFLAAQPKFSFEAQTGFDSVQMNGQHLAFFENKKALVRRPNRLRVETDEADGDEHTFRFDGKQISIDLPGENAYVAVEKSGTIDEMTDYIVDDLEIPVPLHDFFSSNFYQAAQAGIVSGFYVDEATIGKRQCHHLAFRQIDVDFQIWIEDGDRPLPCSLVITYKKAAGQPQYWARFDDWNLSPRAGDKQFEFTPPKGAERLSIRAAVEEIREDTEAK